jgi:hypothetical protein
VNLEIVKETMLLSVNTPFDKFCKKKEIYYTIKTNPLSPRTALRKLEILSKHVEKQLILNIIECSYFSLQLDELTNVCDTSQLCIIIKIIFTNLTIK